MAYKITDESTRWTAFHEPHRPDSDAIPERAATEEVAGRRFDRPVASNRRKRNSLGLPEPPKLVRPRLGGEKT